MLNQGHVGAFCGPHLLYFYLLEVQVSPTIIYSYTHNYYSQIPSQTFPGILLFLLYHNSCILNLTPKIPSRQNSEILLIECAKWTQSKGLVAKANPGGWVHYLAFSYALTPCQTSLLASSVGLVSCIAIILYLCSHHDDLCPISYWEARFHLCVCVYVRRLNCQLSLRWWSARSFPTPVLQIAVVRTLDVYCLGHTDLSTTVCVCVYVRTCVMDIHLPHTAKRSLNPRNSSHVLPARLFTLDIY